MTDFQSYAGPGDKGLRNTELEGYQPVSRIGETVVNSFVDSFEFSLLGERLTLSEMKGTPPPAPPAEDPVVEYRPHFHEVRKQLGSARRVDFVIAPCAHCVPLLCVRL